MEHVRLLVVMELTALRPCWLTFDPLAKHGKQGSSLSHQCSELMHKEMYITICKCERITVAT